MPDKVFVCGDSHLIPLASKHLLKMNKSVTVVARDKSLHVDGATHVEGDPTNLETLSDAGVQQASEILVITKEDWDGAFIVMNSRKLNPDATIVANVNRKSSAEKLYSLGASRVVFSLSVSGHLIASSAASPMLAEFMDRIVLTQDIEIGHIEVTEDSKLAGRQLSDLGIRERTGCWVLGTMDKDKGFHPNPGPETMIENGETLICLGTSESLRQLFDMAKIPQQKADV